MLVEFVFKTGNLHSPSLDNLYFLLRLKSCSPQFTLMFLPLVENFL